MPIPILTYHSIDDSGSPISVPAKLFKGQMENLSQMGFRAISVSQAARLIKSGSDTPDRTVAISFDDGYKSFFQLALPILAQYGFQATVYLITNYCGKVNNWPGHVSPAGDLTLMDWSDIREIAGYGIELGAHTESHPALDQISISIAEREICESKKEIEEKTGSEVYSFAYPYGRYNMDVRNVVGRYFENAVTTRLGCPRIDTDIFQLERLEMYYFRNDNVVQKLESNWFSAWLRARRLLRTIRR